MRKRPSGWRNARAAGQIAQEHVMPLQIEDLVGLNPVDMQDICLVVSDSCAGALVAGASPSRRSSRISSDN